MIESILPPGVIVVEAFADVPGEPVFPGEEDLIAAAVPQRRSEFVTTRRCAREALARLGYPPAPLRSGSRREPRWPPGVVGSLTHCAGYRAAAVAARTVVAAVGIDAEPHAPLPAGVLESVASAAERDHLTALAGAVPMARWDRLLFSAKESVYKAWYPLTGRWLGFEDARLRFDPADRTWTAHILIDGTRIDGGPALTGFAGRYLTGDDLVVTATAPDAD